MDTQLNPITPPFVFHHIPTEVSRRDFTRSINPHVQRPPKGPKPTLSLYKILNDIVSVLHTGIQWDQRKTKRHALHDPNVYKWHKRWSKDGSYHRRLAASILHVPHTDQLDTSVLPGAGSHTVGKKGAKASAPLALSTRQGTKS